MATSPDVATLERETAEARARLANTIEKLTSPATAEAVKQELSDYAQGLKNQALGFVQQKKDDLLGTGKSKAHGVTSDWKEKALANPLGLALIGAGIGWHLYKKPPITSLLVGSGIALLMRGGGNSAQRHFREWHDPYNPERPAAYVPGGIAGYGYPVDEESFGTKLKSRAGATLAHAGEKARDIGETAREAASNVATSVAGAAESARSSIAQSAAAAREAVTDAVDSTRQTVLGAAESATSTVSNAAKAARGSVLGAVESARTSASDAVHRATSSVSRTADGTMRQAQAVFEQTQRNPLLLGALGLLAGTAAVYALRGTERGERFVSGTRKAAGRTVRRTGSQARRGVGSAARSVGDMGSEAGEGLSDAASRIADAAGEVASSVAETASNVGSATARALGTAGETVSSTASSAYEGASSAYRGVADLASRAGRRAPEAGRYVQRQVSDLGERYPLLLGLASLAVGAALGGSMRLSEREQRLMGPYSERIKQRAWEVADEQFGHAKEAAEQLAEHLKAQVTGERRDTSADFETVIGGGKPPVEEGASADGGARPRPSL
jgi:hypothetical protein